MLRRRPVRVYHLETWPSDEVLEETIKVCAIPDRAVWVQ